MGFLDNLSRKVSEAGQKTIEKTKEIADITRLNTMISEEQRVVSTTYQKIGKTYAELHRDDPEEAFADMIRIINTAEEKVKGYERRIQDIKGVQRCEKCGASVPNGAAFCSSSGATMPKITPLLPECFVQCQRCGAEVKEGTRFCTSCGAPMNTEAVIPEIISEEQTEHPIEDIKQEKVCPTCGAQIEEDVMFCTECGTKL